MGRAKDVETEARKNGKQKQLSCCEDARKKKLDDFTIAVIYQLNNLLKEASDMQCGMIAKVLHSAKEELVYWAVDMDFYESDENIFVNRHLYTCQYGK